MERTRDLGGRNGSRETERGREGRDETERDLERRGEAGAGRGRERPVGGQGEEGDEKREFYKILSCMAEEMGKLTSCFKITELIFVPMLLSVCWKHIQLLAITVEVFSL